MTVTLTGQIDDDARHAFTCGGCGVLALALHDRTGWPLVAIDSLHLHRNGRMAVRYAPPPASTETRAGYARPVVRGAVHYTVLHPSCGLLDITGLHDPARLTAVYTHRAGRPLAWGLIDRNDLTDLDWLTWLVDHETAHRYVTPVLALAPPEPPPLPLPPGGTHMTTVPATPENLETAARHFLHLTGTALAGRSVAHLHEDHGIDLDVPHGQPGAARRAAELHANAQNVPANALYRYLARRSHDQTA